jgi:hypothetical protein
LFASAITRCTDGASGVSVDGILSTARCTVGPTGVADRGAEAAGVDSTRVR